MANTGQTLVKHWANTVERKALYVTILDKLSVITERV